MLVLASDVRSATMKADLIGIDKPRVINSLEDLRGLSHHPIIVFKSAQLREDWPEIKKYLSATKFNVFQEL